MHLVKKLILSLIIILISKTIYAQSRVPYNDQNLFLSGANLAWLAFASDVGRGQTDFNSLADIMLQMHDHGGNSLRWWLHTDGSVSPEFNEAGMVVGPGEFTIQDLRTALDLAWEREIGVVLCLWSFNMLEIHRGPGITDRSMDLLTDTTFTKAYIDNALIPMVDSLKGHPGILAWEIFNEPEGMSTLLAWPHTFHVSMTAIQRFVNLCAGAIHRTDPDALVTNGTAHIAALTDAATPASPAEEDLAELTQIEKTAMEQRFMQKYRLKMTAEEITNHYARVASQGNFNYYRDDRLIEAGGDPDGTLDLYSVHYYPAMGTQFSPFSHSAGVWELDKALVIGEFGTSVNNDVPEEDLFIQLFQRGYAGAFPWSWTDNQFSSTVEILNGMRSLWDNYQSAVDVDGIGGDWPLVTLVSPTNGAAFDEGEDVVLEAEASDNDGTVTMVEFFASDTLLIGTATETPYTVTWTNIPPNLYTLTVVATDNEGHERVSNKVKVQVGTPPTKRIEAEAARWQGQNGFTPKSDPSASAGVYIEMTTNVGAITWTVRDMTADGNYEIRFGYRLSFDRPKNQFVNVNGVRVAEVAFDTTLNVWVEEPLNVDLIAGDNEIQMELSWGWMDIDYMSIPVGIITSVEVRNELPGDFALMQNYPNPFNPTTTISYNLSTAEHVKLKIFDVLGREIATLVNEKQTVGRYNFSFEGTNVSSGVYFYQIQAGNKIDTKRMLLVK